MDIDSIFNNGGYADGISKFSNTQKTAAAKTEQTVELSDAEKLENFKKEVWKAIDGLPWNNNVDISIQITDKAFERMMKEPDFKKEMMKMIGEEAAAARPPISTSLTWKRILFKQQQAFKAYDM